MRNRERNDEDAQGNAEPLPADLVLEAALERGQQSIHSSSRRGRQRKGPSRDDGQRQIKPLAKTHKAKTGPCAVLDKPGFWPSALTLSYCVHKHYRRDVESLLDARQSFGATGVPVFLAAFIAHSGTFRRSPAGHSQSPNALCGRDDRPWRQLRATLR
jgi:hypothetical protein